MLRRTYGVSCDGCLAPRLGGWETARQARAEARRRGWRREPGPVRFRSGKDFCPPCAVGREGLR